LENIQSAETQTI